MKVSVKSIFLAIAVMVVCGSVFALDLPIKNINGREYYYYAVKRGETLLSVAAKFGITRDELIQFNPGAADGLRQGTTLYLPVSEFKAETVVAENVIAGNTDKNQFSYKVQRGETLFGLSHRFGVTPDDIIALNPSAKSGIRAGQTLLIPGGTQSPQPEVAVEVEEQANVDEVARNVPLRIEYDRTLKPVEAEIVEVPTTELLEENAPGFDSLRIEYDRSLTPVDVTIEEVDQPLGDSYHESSVALLLPLMLSDTVVSKQSRSALDFVRGFLLGVESMAQKSARVQLSIYDTYGSSENLSDLFDKIGSDSMDVVITPEDEALFRAVADSMSTHKGNVLNLFAVQDTTHYTNSCILQGNAPQNVMYAKACDALMTIYEGYKPVFLISKGGRSEKINFTDFVRARYSELGIEPLEVAYQGMMSSQNLIDKLAADSAGRYVFIPASGSLTEFNKFARALRSVRDSMSDASEIGLFGYPDWTTFRGESKKLLHQLGAVIYSRFYADMTDYETAQFAERFSREYGEEMTEQVPSQALLGYDTARYIFGNINTNGRFMPITDDVFKGLQSSFRFVNDDLRMSAGASNQSIYVITFQTGDNVKVRVI